MLVRCLGVVIAGQQHLRHFGGADLDLFSPTRQQLGDARGDLRPLLEPAGVTPGGRKASVVVGFAGGKAGSRALSEAVGGEATPDGQWLRRRRPPIGGVGSSGANLR